MFRSLFGFPTKPRGHKDAEKELVEVMELFSKYPSFLAETDKTEFKNECERYVFYDVKLTLLIDDYLQTSERNTVV